MSSSPLPAYATSSLTIQALCRKSERGWGTRSLLSRLVFVVGIALPLLNGDPGMVSYAQTINPAPQYSLGYYPNSGSSTTIGGATNTFILSTGLSESAINGVTAGSNISIIKQAGDGTQQFNNPHYDTFRDDSTTVPARPWNVKDSGAACDAQIAQATLTATSTTITFANPILSAAWLSDGNIWIESVGLVSGVMTRFDATLTYVSSTSATMSVAAPFSSQSGTYVIIGHQDDDQLAAAIALGILTGREIDAPVGTCWSSTPQRFGANIHGQGALQGGLANSSQSTVFLFSAGIDGFQALDPSQGGFSGFPPYLNTGNYAIAVNPVIDATEPWQICTNGTCVQQTPLYRPLGILGPDGQNPLAPQWIEGGGVYNAGATNGVATMANGSAVACIPTSETRPANTEQIVFPYQAVGTAMFETTVSSQTGAGCPGGTNPITLGATWSPATPGAPVEWFAGTSFQNIQTSVPASSARSSSITAWSITSNVATFTSSNSYSAGQILTLNGFGTSTFFNGEQVTVLSSGLSGTQFEGNFTHANGSATESGTSSIFPLKIALANSIVPSAAGPSGLAPFGYVQIDAEQCAYYGNSNYPTESGNISTSPTITLQACAQNTTTAASHSVDAIIVPLNPFEPSWPWPVTPTLTSGQTTPANAEFFPAQNVGNAAISFPVQDGTDFGDGAMTSGHVHDILIEIGGGTSIANSTGYQVQNDTAAMYFVNPPFISTIDNIQIVNTFYGIVEGTPSINTSKYFANYPTANGNHWANITDHSAALPMDLIADSGGTFSGLSFWSQSFAPPNNYIPGWTPSGFPNSGSQGDLMLDAPFDDESAAYPYLNTGVQYAQFKFQYLEAENGFFNQTQPLDYWNCVYCTWTNTTPQSGGIRYVTGAYQQFYGGQLSSDSNTPIVVLGSNINFDRVAGIGASGLGTSYGSDTVLNWGPNNSASGPGDNVGGTPAGPNIPQLMGNNFAPVFGQTEETLANGNVTPGTMTGSTTPYVASGDGFFSPDQFNANPNLDPRPMTTGWTLDPTSPITGGYAECKTSSLINGCNPVHMVGDYVSIGQGQRLTNGKYYGHISLKNVGGLAIDFRLYTSCSGSPIYDTGVFTPASTWTDYPIPVIDLSTDSGCYFYPAFSSDGAGDGVYFRIGYLDMIPLPNEPIDNNIDVINQMLLNNSAGTTGQVLTSQGPGSPDIWTSPTTASCTSGNNYACLNLANTFTQAQTISMVTPYLQLTDTTFGNSVQIGGYDGYNFISAPFGAPGYFSFLPNSPDIQMQDNAVLGFTSTGSIFNSADTGISRDSSGVFDFGNGGLNDKSGRVQAAIFGSGTASNTDGIGELSFSASTSATYTWVSAYTSHPECVVTPQADPGGGVRYYVTYTSTTSFTINFTSAFTGNVSYICSARN